MSVAFERLSKALDEAKNLPRDEAVTLLHESVRGVPRHSELLRWYLNEVAEVLELDKDPVASD